MAAREAGASHLRDNLPCQDWYKCRLLDGDVFIAAVADGAGSAPRASVGAFICVESVVGCLAARIERGESDYCEVLRGSAADAREIILSEAARTLCHPGEFATTLLVAIIGPDRGAALQLGDGVISVRCAETETWTCVTWPQRGEFANATNFITDDDALGKLWCDFLPSDVVDVGMVTDGLEALALVYSANEPHQPFFEGFARPLRIAQTPGEVRSLSADLGRFLTSERVTDRTDDDVCLVFATRTPFTNSD